jgi:hypothetical protein
MTRGCTLLAAVVCAVSCGPGVAAPAPLKGSIVSENEYPNVHARLRVARSGVGVPALEDELEIWLKGTRFRVRDGHGRRYDELVGDVNEPRGLGVPARTMEDIMDRQSEVERRESGSRRAASQLFGDRATDQGWVYPADGKWWTTKARRLAPVAEQILARDQPVDLPAAGQVTRLGRPATEYRGTVPVVADGTPTQNVVARVIAPPFLLLDAAHDSANPELSYVREVVLLEEGTVTDADVVPP